MTTTTHPVTPEDVMAFLDSELSAAEAQLVSAHVEHCAECTELAQQFRSTSLSLSRWNVETVPGNLEDSVTSAAASSGSGLKIRRAGVFIRASFWTWRQWAAASACTLAALLLVSVAVPNLLRSRRMATFFQGRQKNEIVTALLSQGESASQKSKGPGRSITQQNSLATPGSPGIAPDSNGLLQGPGGYAENSLSIDGELVTDQQSKVFSGPMIARAVSLSIIVKDFGASRSSLDTILARHHGYSAQLNVSTLQNAPRGLQASLRIPATELSLALVELKTLGRVENESQSGEEVTQEHTDLVARLKNSHETEQRLRSILEQRTGKVVEILGVEREIERVRGDIERMEAEQKALEHRVDFSTVELQLTEEYKAQLNPPATPVSTRIHNAFVAGYRNASETLLGTLLFLAEYGLSLLIWVAILLLPAIFIWRRYRRSLATV